MESNSPLLEIDFGSNGGKQSFFTPQDFEDFYSREEEFWKWLSDAKAKDAALATIHSNISFPWIKSKTHLQNLKTSFGTKQDIKGHVNQLSTLLNAYIEKRSLCSVTTEAKFCNEVYSKNPKIGCLLVSHFLSPSYQQGFVNSSNDWIGSLIEYNNFHNGLSKENVAGVIKSIGEQNQRLSDEIKKAKDEVNLLTTNNRSLLEKTDSLLKTKTSEFDEKFKSADENLRQKFIHTETELKNISDTYDKKLSLQSSVQYWSDRKQSSYVFSVALGIVTVILMVVLAGFSKGELEKVLSANQEALNSKLAFAALLVVAFIGIWLTRILVKLFMSYVHSAKDASERIVLLKTYLAMSREG